MSELKGALTRKRRKSTPSNIENVSEFTYLKICHEDGNVIKKIEQTKPTQTKQKKGNYSSQRQDLLHDKKKMLKRRTHVVTIFKRNQKTKENTNKTEKGIIISSRHQDLCKKKIKLKRKTVTLFKRTQKTKENTKKTEKGIISRHQDI